MSSPTLKTVTKVFEEIKLSNLPVSAWEIHKATNSDWNSVHSSLDYLLADGKIKKIEMKTGVFYDLL